jgi:glycine cleavage system H protein
MRFLESHEWAEVDGDVATVGISAFAAEQLGDVVYVELPQIGKMVKHGEAMAVVESAKAASDVYAPVSGEVVAVNDKLTSAPETVNEAAQDAGWFVKIRLTDPSELEKLMDEAAYAAVVK